MVKEIKLALFLGAGASVPTTQQLKNELLKKYKYEDIAKSTPDKYYLYSIVNFPGFEDVEHVLQCIKNIDDFFNTSQYGGRYLLECTPKLIFQDPQRPWELSTLVGKMKDIRKMIEDDVF
jgi:hypothetical protein